MPDKCETCGGGGLIVGIAGPSVSVWVCVACKRVTSGNDLRERLRLCCEAHDGLLSLCKEAREMVEGMLAVVNLEETAEFADRLNTAVAKAQLVKEPTPTRGEDHRK